MPNERSIKLTELQKRELARMAGFVRKDLEARINPSDIRDIKIVDSPFPPSIEVVVYGGKDQTNPVIGYICRERCLKATRVRGPNEGDQIYHLRFRNNGKYFP